MGSQTLFPIVDLHTHPLIPLYYFRKDLGKNHRRARFFPYTPFGTHIDMPKLKASGVKVIVCCVYAVTRLPYRNCFEAAKAQISLFGQWIANNQETIAHAKTPQELEAITAQGKIAAVLALEGGHHLAGEIGNVKSFRQAGVFYITLVHFLNTPIAQSSLFAGFPSGRPGLRAFGRCLVPALNQSGIIVDVAHCSERAFWEVLENAKAPPIYSHGGSLAICDHPRNLTDEQTRALAKRGGLIGLILYPRYLRRKGFRIGIEGAVAHLRHWLEVCGPEPLAIGTDMNGVMVIREVGDYSGMPRLAEAVEKAFGAAVARKILFENAFGFIKRHWGQPTP